MNDFIEKVTDYYRRGTEGIKLIYLCVGASIIYWIFNFILIKGFSFSLDSFFLLSAHSFIPYIWTIFTYPFIHSNFFDLLFVMIMLYFSERIFRLFFNGESFVKFFFLGNLFGGIFFLLFSYFTGQTFVILSGAIAGVYSVIFSIISYNPKMQVSLFPLPIRFPIYILGLVLIGLDVISLLSQNYILGLFMARFSAAAFGYFYMKAFQTGNDFLGKLMPDFNKLSKVFQRKNNSFKTKKSRSNDTFNSSRPKTDEEFNIEKIKKQKRIDAILDKISKTGYESLTKEEKDFLFNSSK